MGPFSATARDGARSAAMGRIKMSMEKRQSKSTPTWAEVKTKLAEFDRAGLLDLVHSLYATDQHNQAFVHARLGLGEDTLEPFKKTIHRWLRPDLSRRQDVSVARAKRAISDYKKALGDPAGVAELMVFYCEEAVGFYRDVTYDDSGYWDALVRMFERVLHTTSSLPANVQRGLIGRLASLRNLSHQPGYGVGDDIDILFSEFVSTRGASTTRCID
jgi:hypothetical protein